MKINKKWLPIKAHYFFLLGAMGPIIPQLPVYGKELGISPVIMGTIAGFLPFGYLVAKPIFGLLVDLYRNNRKSIFMLLIVIMTASFVAIIFIPPRPLLKISYSNLTNVTILDTCNAKDTGIDCAPNQTTRVVCSSKCLSESVVFLVEEERQLCSERNLSFWPNSTCNLICEEDIEDSSGCFYSSVTFWSFITCMVGGSVAFNVINSISDAICLDVLGEDGDYGLQRVWGTIGYGIAALIAGYAVNIFSGDTTTYAPAFIVMLICSALDIVACIKLQLPIIEAPKNIFKDLKKMLKDGGIQTFLIFAVFAGILESLMIFFILWYLEDLAVATNTENVKLIEGLSVAAEALGGEVIFFAISGKILKRFGHVNCFSMCFIGYSLRIWLISVAPSPWWFIPIHFFLNGPSYALSYFTIVAYANEIAPPGASATMQGIAAGMDDGLGFAIGCVVAGLLFKFIGPKQTLQVFSAFGALCGLSHALLHKTVLRRGSTEEKRQDVEYKTPEEAHKATF